MRELWQLSASELAAMIRGRSVSSREVVEAHLQRIETVNSKLNAIRVVLGERALEAAAGADRALAGGKDVGLLHGVPITVKENVDVDGTATTWGAGVLAGNVASSDAPHVAHLRAAGAIPIGRTNMPDFALRWHTDSSIAGPTVSPWDASSTPGGSSGGEGASVATGMSPLGMGNDLGGSIRWPSQCCGITGLRTTLGRVPSATSVEPANAPIGIQLMNVEGPMARRVSDLRLALGIMSRPSPRDPWYVPAPLEGPPVSTPVRVALVRDPAGGGVHPQVAAGVDAAARHFSDAGYAVEEAEPPSVAQAAETWIQLIIADVAGMRPMLQAMAGADANTFIDLILQASPPPDPATWAQAFMTRQGLLREWSMFLDRYPLVLAPVCCALPFPVGKDLDPAGALEITMAMRMVVTVNLLGLPSLAVPVGAEGGLPQGVQVVGARYREDLCLDAGEAIERMAGVLTPIDPR